MKYNYHFHTRPYKHQKAALCKMLSQDYGGALLMEPRTGKTKVAIDWAGCLVTAGQLTHLLVVCPPKVMETWANEFATHCPLRAHLTLWTAEQRKQGLPDSPPGYDLYVLITSYAAFSQPLLKTKSGRKRPGTGRLRTKKLVLGWLSGKKSAMVLDESHKIKNPGSAASRTLLAVRPSVSKCLLLTGTPLTKHNQPSNIWAQLRMLSPELISSYPRSKDFDNYFGDWQYEKGFSRCVGLRHLDELSSLLAGPSYQCKRADCFDLPPVDTQKIAVALSQHEHKVYVDMATKAIARLKEVNSMATGELAIIQALRLAQITSGFITDEQGETRLLGMSKGNALHDLLDELCVDGDQQVVVMCRWRHDLDMALGVCAELNLPASEISGRTHNTGEALDAFSSGRLRVLVCQAAAASLGLDMSTAGHMVWVSHTPVWTDYRQACDRIALHHGSTTQWHLVASGTVDEVLLETLNSDTDTAEQLWEPVRLAAKLNDMLRKP